MEPCSLHPKSGCHGYTKQLIIYGYAHIGSCEELPPFSYSSGINVIKIFNNHGF